MTLTSRNPPPPDVGILPSLERYMFFQGADEVPFDGKATTFSLANAAWLADFALLAYRKHEEVQSCMLRLGFRTQFFSLNSTQCYVCHDDSKVLVAFRGTEIVGFDALNDILTDADFDLVPFGGQGRVHKGFERKLDALWPSLRDHLLVTRAGTRERSLWITGHSMGAALAILLAARYGKCCGVYTYGCPRVGDERFANSYREPTYRFVNNNDYVTQLPPALPGFIPKLGGRRHVGELHYIDGLGRVQDRAPDQIYRVADGAMSAMRYQLANLERFLWLLGYTQQPEHLFAVPLDSLRDHAPIYYAMYLWNALAERHAAAERRAVSGLNSMQTEEELATAG